jgi:hypothetical protein
MKRYLTILLAAAGAAFLAAPGLAATSGIDGQPLRPDNSGTKPSIQPSFVGGIYAPDTSVRVLRFTETGGLFVANESGDRDHWVLQNAGLQATDIPRRAIFKSQVPFSCVDYNAIALMVSWAASDTDTVALEIAIVGKQSTNPGDGLDFLVDMNPGNATPDGVSIFNDAGAAYSAWSSSRVYTVIRGGAVGTDVPGILKATNAITTNNAVYIPLAEIQGQLMNFPIIQVWVINKKHTQMDDVTVDFWAKVR